MSEYLYSHRFRIRVDDRIICATSIKFTHSGDNSTDIIVTRGIDPDIPTLFQELKSGEMTIELLNRNEEPARGFVWLSRDVKDLGVADLDSYQNGVAMEVVLLRRAALVQVLLVERYKKGWETK